MQATDEEFLDDSDNDTFLTMTRAGVLMQIQVCNPTVCLCAVVRIVILFNCCLLLCLAEHDADAIERIA